MGTHLSYYVTCWKCWHWLLSDFFFISLLQNRLSRMAFGRTLINLIMLFQFIASLMKYAYIYSIPKVGVVVLRRSYKSFLKMYMYGCGTLFTSSFIWYLHTSRFLSNTADVAISWVLIRQKARHFPGLPDVHKQKVSWWWNSTLLCCIKGCKVGLVLGCLRASTSLIFLASHTSTYRNTHQWNDEKAEILSASWMTSPELSLNTFTYVRKDLTYSRTQELYVMYPISLIGSFSALYFTQCSGSTCTLLLVIVIVRRQAQRQ